MERKIIVTIPQFGAPKVEAEGFNGEGCAEATASIERALNSQGVESRDYKPEWSAPVEDENEETEGLTW